MDGGPWPKGPLRLWPRPRPTTTDLGFGRALEAAVAALPRGVRTRFAPAPTGFLHLGHVANALVTWHVARASRGQVVLRVEDHDRQRCRPAFETALLDDVEALGFVPDEPSIASLRSGGPSAYRQSDNGATYATAVALIERVAPVYACDCSRSTFAAWAGANDRAWSGPGCPGRCAGRGLARDARGVAWRVALGDGEEPWTDLVLGPRSGAPSGTGDLPIRDRHGNWTYALCVVVDDMRHEIDLVIRGEDLVDATAAQIRLARLLGRATPPRFLHHPLIRRHDGRKLSKADGATGVRELLLAGGSADAIRSDAAAAIGLA
ncbi:MAG: tRNA glutamyl-Q(34) synthetase GluQRS [Chloroflexota bacterium]|nr:MAG: tRNA glutamyl-Q(34) synthetase GluQRS [Chloroflexota bacterium]